MLLLVFGIAAAFGFIAFTAFGLLSLVHDGVGKHDETDRVPGEEETFLNEEPA